MKNIVVEIPDELYEKMQKDGFANGSTLSTLSNEWIKHRIAEAVKAYGDMNHRHRSFWGEE